MYCNNCGHEVKDSDSFCSNCGARIFRPTPAADPAAVSSAKQPHITVPPLPKPAPPLLRLPALREALRLPGRSRKKAAFGRVR